MLVDATNLLINKVVYGDLIKYVMLVPGKGLVRSACLNIWALLEFFIEPVWTIRNESIIVFNDNVGRVGGSTTLL